MQYVTLDFAIALKLNVEKHCSSALHLLLRIQFTLE